MGDVIQARTIVVLGDCHIHPAKGITWPDAALDAFKGAELFITLGDMGERAGLDALSRLAPVIGVRGRDDDDDPRTAPRLRLLAAGKLRIGCVFDPVEARIALSVDPLQCAPTDSLARLFGDVPDAILWASTHVPASARIDGRCWINPGSATLPAENASASFARLTLTDGELAAEVVAIQG